MYVCVYIRLGFSLYGRNAVDGGTPKTLLLSLSMVVYIADLRHIEVSLKVASCVVWVVFCSR